MNFLRLRISKKTKLILWAALFFFLLISIILGYHYVRRYVFYSDEQVKTLVTDYLHDRNIDITFDDIKINILWRPTIVLTKVHLTYKTPQVDYDLNAEKLKISLSYKIIWNKIEIYRLSIFNSDLYLNLKNIQLKKFSEYFTNQVATFIPRYIENYQGKIVIENKTKYYGPVLQDINLKLFSPKKYLAYLEIEGNNRLLNTIFFNMQGIINFNGKGLQTDNLDLSLIFYAPTKQYKIDARFNLDWDMMKNNLFIHHMNFTGTELVEHVNYEGSIAKINWVDYQQILIPKISINANQSQNNTKTDGYLVLNNTSCIKNSCLIDDISFLTRYAFKDKSFIINSNATMELNLEEQSVAMTNLVFNSKQLSDEGVVPLWVLNLKGYLFYKLDDYLLLDLTGLLDKQFIQVVVQNTLENHFPKGLWEILLRLDSFDITSYIEAFSDVSSVKIYDGILAKIPQVFNLLNDKQLKMSFGIKQLNFPGFFLTNIIGNLTHDDHHIQLTNLKGKFFEGDFLTNLEIKLDKNIKYKIEQKLNNLNLGIMLFYFTNFPLLSGNGNSYISLQTEGNNVAELLAHLNGSSSLEIYQGTILGYNLENILHSEDKLTSLHDQTFTKIQNISKEELKKTQFDSFKFASQWTNGIGESVILKIDSPQFQLRGKGTINLINASLDYSLLLNGYVTKNNKRVNVIIPLRLVGNLLTPQCYLDSKQVLELLDGSDHKEKMLKEFIRQQWELIR